jgi:hypothetical protein|tara:strand:+ start:5538 stop:6164 length:627 start_codon:yes stop_codon:yes gene_type:complete
VAIQIKRSTNTATPTTLEFGELAWSGNGDVVYIGNGSAVVAVAGRRVTGTLTANQAIVVDSNSFIDEIKTGGLTLTTSGTANTKIVGLVANVELANSTTIATSTAVKNYVDENAVTGGSTQLNGLTDVTITDRQQSDFMMASNTTHVRNVTVAGGVTATANDTVVTFNCVNSSADFLSGANLQFTTAFKDGDGNRLQILYANGDAAWG